LFFLLAGLACSDTDEPAGLEPADFSYDDLRDSWRGTVDSWRVDNGSQTPSYDLQNVNVNLIIEQDTYWLQLTQFSDSLEYQYYNRGFWIWDPDLHNILIFEMYEEVGTQIFNPVRGDVGQPDSIGGGGGNVVGGGSSAPPDTLVVRKGDNTEKEEQINCGLEYNGDSIRLFDFNGAFDLGDITLERF
jgi:hypothetical protein